MSRSTGRVLSVGDVVENAVATTINPDIAVGQYTMPPVVPAVKQKFLIGALAPPPSDPFKAPPLFFNQTGNNPLELFEAPVENFNFKIMPTQTAELPITREGLTKTEGQSRYSSLLTQS
jgi:hypothetical protein